MALTKSSRLVFDTATARISVLIYRFTVSFFRTYLNWWITTNKRYRCCFLPPTHSPQPLREIERCESDLRERLFAGALSSVDAWTAFPNSRPFLENAPNPPVWAKAPPAGGIPQHVSCNQLRRAWEHASKSARARLGAAARTLRPGAAHSSKSSMTAQIRLLSTTITPHSGARTREQLPSRCTTESRRACFYLIRTVAQRQRITLEQSAEM
jgi:hypothetical protein